MTPAEICERLCNEGNGGAVCSCSGGMPPAVMPPAPPAPETDMVEDKMARPYRVLRRNKNLFAQTQTLWRNFFNSDVDNGAVYKFTLHKIGHFQTPSIMPLGPKVFPLPWCNRPPNSPLMVLHNLIIATKSWGKEGRVIREIVLSLYTLKWNSQ